jgi:hypothetical protein
MIKEKGGFVKNARKIKHNFPRCSIFHKCGFLNNIFQNNSPEDPGQNKSSVPFACGKGPLGGGTSDETLT